MQENYNMNCKLINTLVQIKVHTTAKHCRDSLRIYLDNNLAQLSLLYLPPGQQVAYFVTQQSFVFHRVGLPSAPRSRSLDLDLMSCVIRLAHISHRRDVTGDEFRRPQFIKWEFVS